MQTAQRYSKKREAILEILNSTHSHPSAEWIYLHLKERYPDISLGTVYRNLAQFKEQGRIISVGNVGGVERFDAHCEPHSHFICSQCGSVQDLEQLQIPENLCADAARETSAKVDHCWLTFSGLCAQCEAIQSDNVFEE